MVEKEINALTKVIASLHTGYLTVIYGYGYGHIDCGVAKDISIACIPPDLIMPNSEFILVCEPALCGSVTRCSDWRGRDRQTGEAIGVERIH